MDPILEKRADRLTAPAFLISVGLAALAAGAGGIFLPGEWYQSLAKPSWTPPSWVFAPVWFTLYVLIAVAGRLIWRDPSAKAAQRAWVAQIVLVGLWSVLFFGLQRIDLALYDVALLWLAIAAFILLAWNRSRIAALVFIPYLAWVSLAAALNLSIWHMN